MKRVVAYSLASIGVLAAVGIGTFFITRGAESGRMTDEAVEARMADAAAAYALARYSDVADILEELADANVPLAQYRLGMMNRQGVGVPRNDERARALLSSAASQGLDVARDALIEFLIEDAENAGSLADGVSFYEQAARLGDPGAKAVLGSYYFSGQVLPQDVGRGLDLIREAAEAGDVRAQSNLGFAYRTGTGVARDDAEAFRWYLMAAEAGLVRAQAAVGLLYEEGAGVERNVPEATRWYLNAFEAGAPGVDVRLGQLLAAGQMQAGNPNESALWVRAAARAGDERAIAWLQTEADTGDAAALYALATMYDAGEGVTQHLARAADYYRHAAELGAPAAQLVMARRIAAGLEGEPDYMQAHIWANLAAANGVEGAAAERDVFAQFLTPEQLADAQDAAADWRPEN